MSNKVLMFPKPSHAAQDDSNSINQIVLRLAENLPMFGWEITEDAKQADIVAVHAGTDTDVGVDVAHCHGLHPTGIHHEPDKTWHYQANYNVEYTLRLAKRITVPSEWVADILRRDMNINPVIVPWGISRREWHKGAHQGYTLWNKTRPDATCDPTPIEFLSKSINDSQFVTTFTNLKSSPPNLRVTGRMTYLEMQKIIQDASLYLGTTKETFGIGTLEAMACGIPVLGYNWGATPDIVEHGIHGYLVEPYDLEGLVQGWRWCMSNRKQLSINARERAIEDFYMWERVAEQMAGVYDSVLAEKNQAQPFKVSVVIPCHNYGKFLREAFASVAAQKAPFEFEIIIVDDCSSDNSPEVAQRLINYQSAEYGYKQAKLIRLDTNLGVAEARNKGIAEAQGKYIVCLDADDRLGAPDFLARLALALDANPFLGLVYTGLAVFRTDEPHAFPSEWPKAYEPKLLLGQNQVPTCNMFRKRAWEQVGGYKGHYTPAEDAALWLAMGMAGWMIEQVTPEPIFYYRLHSNSLSSVVRTGQKREPNWKMAFEGSPESGYPLLSIIPPDGFVTHPVKNYDNPLISVIIPIGKGHESIAQRAIDSVHGQTEWRWECIIVNDTGKPMVFKESWIKEVIPKTGASVGAGAARNAGAAIAKGKYLLFLDADDYLQAGFLEICLQQARLTGRYVYTDTQLEEDGKFTRVNQSQDYRPEEALLRQLHPISALIPKQWFDSVGGFDESLPAWEDWDLFIKMAIQGHCGSHISQPLFIYGFDLGHRRNAGASQSDALKAQFYEKYAPYINKDIAMCKCAELTVGKVTAKLDSEPSDDLVRVILIAGGKAKATVIGISGKRYARAQAGDTLLISKADFEAEPSRFKAVGLNYDIEPTEPPLAPAAYKGISTLSKDF